MTLLKYFVLFILLSISCKGFSQDKDIADSSHYTKNWFISASCGIQISGIKSEDFISSNVSPSFLLNAGVWFNPEIALQIGYKGSYFYTISDNDNHHYDFVFGEVLLNINELIVGNKSRRSSWSIIIHSGAGYFNNKYYDRPNICGILGLINNVKVLNRIDVFIDISAIIGWDIYQGDEDILPYWGFGVCYMFK
jgi:hypothetical protein